jgi:hypothetical protein
MRQERMSKRPVRRRTGGGSDADPITPSPRPDTRRTLKKTDELLRRLERLVQG